MTVAQTAVPRRAVAPTLQHLSDNMELRDALAMDLDGSFEQLVLCYQNQLYAFALRVSGNAQDAEEITQDAFVRAYRALAGYPAEQVQSLALKSWLYQIALNVFRNRIRGHKPQLVPLDNAGEGGMGEPAADERRQPDNAFEQAEREREMGALLAALPERYRVPVVLRHVEGFCYDELAALLHQPVGTVKSNVHRGVNMLRKLIAAQDEKGQ